MTVRVARLDAPATPFRWLAPLFAAAVSIVRRRVAEPGMPTMSSEWLLSHEQLVGRRAAH